MSGDILNNENVLLEPGDVEIQRLTLSFAVVKAQLVAEFGGLVAAPIDFYSKSELRILDQACANGLWLRDLHRTIRSSGGGNHSYVGTDIVPSYFTEPSSETFDLRFHIQSMTDPWPSSLQSSFDLVHSRFSLAGAGTFPLQKVVAMEVSLLKSGGWLQLEEMNLQQTLRLPKNGLDGGSGPAATELWVMLAEMFRMLGPGDDFGSKLKRWMEDAGLVDVVDQEITVRYGENSQDGIPEGVFGAGESLNVDQIREMGVQAMELVTKGLTQGSQYLPAPLQSLTPDELRALPQRVAEECRKMGSAFVVHVVYGRKP